MAVGTHPEVRLKGFKLSQQPKAVAKGNCALQVTILTLEGRVLHQVEGLRWGEGPSWEVALQALRVQGDIKVVFKANGKKLFAFCFNTSFLHRNSYVLGKSSLDGAVKDKQHRKFPAAFTCEVRFEGVTGSGDGEEPDENNTPFKPEAPSPEAEGPAPEKAAKGWKGLFRSKNK
jgi:hypothetical protein